MPTSLQDCDHSWHVLMLDVSHIFQIFWSINEYKWNTEVYASHTCNMQRMSCKRVWKFQLISLCTTRWIRPMHISQNLFQESLWDTTFHHIPRQYSPHQPLTNWFNIKTFLKRNKTHCVSKTSCVISILSWDELIPCADYANTVGLNQSLMQSSCVGHCMQITLKQPGLYTKAEIPQRLAIC